MQFLARWPKFQHLSRNHDSSFRRHRSQRIHHCIQGRWIGIVTIVDDRDVAHLDDRTAFVSRNQRGQRAGGFRKA